MARKRVAILISGRGSNMVALIDAAKDAAYPAEIALVISNEPAAASKFVWNTTSYSINSSARRSAAFFATLRSILNLTAGALAKVNMPGFHQLF